jgi:branched-chain amino acid transport system ATP-binding protein
VTVDQQPSLAELAPRGLVPSTREQRSGVEMPDYTGPVPVEALPKRERRRAALRQFLRDADPRTATGGESARPIIVFASLGMLQGIAASSVHTNFLAIYTELDMSIKSVTTIGLVAAILANVVELTIGYSVDRFPRIPTGFVVAFLFACFVGLIGVVPTLFAYVLYSMGVAFFGGFGGGAAVQQPLMADYYPPEVRGRVYGLTATCGTAGAIAGPLIGGVLGQLLGWRTAVVATACLALAASFLYFTLRNPPRGRWDRIYLGASEETAATRQRPAGLIESYRAVKSIGTLRRIWLAGIFATVGGAFILPTLVVYTAQKTASPLLLGILVAGQGCGTLLGLAIGGTVTDRLVRDQPGRVMSLLGTTYLVGLAAFLVMALDLPFAAVVPVLLVVPFITAIPQISKQVLLSLVVPARLRGFGLQSEKIFNLIGQVVILPIVLVFAGDDIARVFLLGTPPLAIAAIIYLTAHGDVAKDIENARLAVLAEEEMASSRRGDKPKLLVCRQVDVHYDGVQVLFGVDFDVDEGELVALLGTNGAGKSTLLRAISGLSEPTGGAVFLDGRDVTHAPPHELASFGVVQMPGGKGVFPALTVAENLRTAGWLDEDGYAERVEQVYDLFPGLRSRSRQLAGTLSGGEQQMVALGQALIMRPKILLIDELSLGLAPTVVEQLLQALEAIREVGTTVILVEQSVNLALTVADRAVFMEKGEIRFSGPTAELMRRPDILRSVYLKGTSPGSSPARTRPRTAPATAAPDRAVVLSVTDLSVSYGGVQALCHASLKVGAAEIVGIVGPNGAGKTTLFDAVSGFAPITSGVIAVAGTDVTGRRPDERAKLGLARSFQDARLFSSLTVVENIQVAMERHAEAAASAAMSALWLPQVRTAERRMRRRAEGLIELLGLGAFRDKFVSELSTGSRRIVDLACVMATDPELLLLDEPSSGIAQAEAEELGPLLTRLRRDVGCGLLVIEHDIRLLGAIADRMVGMVRGETIIDGSVEDVLADPVLVSAYLGTSERVLARSGEPVSQPATVRSSS